MDYFDYVLFSWKNDIKDIEDFVFPNLLNNSYYMILEKSVQEHELFSGLFERSKNDYRST